jgi:lipopolysaccharide biosynthesis glycosyltransferase
MSELALVLSANERYAQGLAVALRSALINLSPVVRPMVFVLDHGLSAPTKARLTRMASAAGWDELCWRPIPAGRLDRHDHKRFTSATYARLLIPDLLPASVRRAVYLDSDVLVRRDLSPLFTTALGDAPVGAVRDATILTTADPGSGVREPGSPRPYFNNGVLVIDLDRWRMTGLGARALEYAAAGGEPLPWADQDALNAVNDDWRELPATWNLQHRRLRTANKNAAVLHFTGQKPWYGSCTSPGTAAWVRTLVASRLLTPRQTIRWLLRFAAQRARYRAGSLKLELAARAHRGTPPS